MKKTPLRSRKAPLRSSGPPERRTRVKAVNRKRRVSEFARCFHSKARVAFVKTLPCANDAKWALCMGPIENAHIETGGTGYRADYTSIIPLCKQHHWRSHAHGWIALPRLDTPEKREAAAARTEKLWAAHLHQRAGAAT
jgi:hypothetical protein